jgi:chromosome segregation ATPase
MFREINNKLDCCIYDNEKWCKSAINRIPHLIKEIKEKQKDWETKCKHSENAYKIAQTNIEHAKKQEGDMKKYVKYVTDKENKTMKEIKQRIKRDKKTIKKWDKEIADYNKQLKIFKKRVSVCNKKARCPNGTRKNKKTGKCEKK